LHNNFFKQVADKNLADVGTTTYDRSGKSDPKIINTMQKEVHLPDFLLFY
jgi:hypothetical protein